MSKAIVLVWVAILSLTAILPQIQASKYARKVSYENEILLRCPDKNKATVQILQEHADVWHQGKESIDMRLDRRQFARVQSFFPECTVLIEDMEAHVQAAEAEMFPSKKAEQEEWLKAVVQAVLPKGDLKDCEAKIEDWEAYIQDSDVWFKEYHNYEDTVDWYKRLAEDNPNLVTFIPSIGETYEGRKMPCIHFTASKDPKRKKFYMQCQIHAREWISGATCMYIAHHFVKNYMVDPEVTELMNTLEIVLVPIVNPDGYVYTWTTDRMWRKNRVPDRMWRKSGEQCIGVDINRNFPDGFRQKYNPCAEDYSGTGAISELETQHITNNFRNNAPIIGSIDFHSYGQLLLRPFGKDNSTDANESYNRHLGDAMVEIIGRVHGVTYTSEHSHDLYYCYGIAADWLYGDDAARTNGGYRSASFCIELRDTEHQHGFLLPKNQIIPTAEEIVPAVKYYMKEMIKKPIMYHMFNFSPLRQQERQQRH